MARSFQEWVYWLEVGRGARIIRIVAAAVAVLLLSLWICSKQFHGPKSEWTLRQAVVGRQLADGHGFTTLVNDPQTAAILQSHGGVWPLRPFPELNAAPGYPAVVGAWLGLIPSNTRSAFFSTSPMPPDGFIPDYILLGLNVVLFWIALGWTFRLGSAVFDRTVGLVSALALLLTATIWDQIVLVNGTALSMVLLLALMEVAWQVEVRSRLNEVPYRWMLLLGALCGCLFLTDYVAGAVVIAAGFFVGHRFVGERTRALAMLFAGFLLVAGPWCLWMFGQSGSPIGLAWQDVAMKLDGTNADPGVVRATLSASPPALELAKWGNKGLSALEISLTDRWWSGGAQWFAGFFVAAFLFRFRDPRVQALRMFFLGLLVCLILSNCFLSSGETERWPLVYASPLLIIFGTGFAAVLIASSRELTAHAGWVFAALLALQAIPLGKRLIEPSRLHFQYPPYYPPLFLGMTDEMNRRSANNPAWMCDVPAGAAWYSGQRVWLQPNTLHDFFAIGAEQPMLACVLTPKTLDRPYFSELAHRTDNAHARVDDWAEVYAGLAAGRLPESFPLNLPQKIADNFYVLIDPQARPLPRKP
ncbi:MAG TPA: hypothetical protein VIM69_05075 [Opitutaceae bacterium]